MPTQRPKLTLDEQSFQDMLAAAFTIQEHNTQRKKKLPPPERVCGQCGVSVSDDSPLCQKCSQPPRQGEELQRKWASLWMMSQEQGLGPDTFSSAHEEAALPATVTAELPARYFPEEIEIPLSVGAGADSSELEKDAEWRDLSSGALSKTEDLPELTNESESLALDTIDEAPAPGSLRDWQVKLRFHRADFYLVVAIAVSTVAMIWVLSATPTVDAQRKPRLRPWERALVSMGLAEPPPPPPRHGNPNISVWVDPKTALYYCVGEELYGKAPGGHLATQREAQLDQFQPAGRVPCE